MAKPIKMNSLECGSGSENSFLTGPEPVGDWTRCGGIIGGAAASVASGGVVAALGTDTGRSGNPQPTGLIGMKPTYGRVSRYGVVAYGSSLEQVGPLTRTVWDNARLLEVIAGHDHSRWEFLSDLFQTTRKLYGKGSMDCALEYPR